MNRWCQGMLLGLAAIGFSAAPAAAQAYYQGPYEYGYFDRGGYGPYDYGYYDPYDYYDYGYGPYYEGYYDSADDDWFGGDGLFDRADDEFEYEYETDGEYEVEYDDGELEVEYDD